ncbi:MAG: response regulator [Alphaproteobacteria bacterium]|uniref:Response regulator n=1 Tax=Candidatus Nitrobium versatile TaxID=2884831 RepID=A0A953JEV7_9BACT|nr:response regulator [Candidatus Nitrobium versatile]
MATVRVLVIDDEEIVRISCRKALRSAGYEVDTAASGKECLDLLEEGMYPVVLIDLKMPAMDGIETLVTIKKRYPDLQVIIMSGYDTVEHVVESLCSGAAHYIEKPFTPDMLVKRISEVLETCP